MYGERAALMVDLHIHSTYSDGADSPESIIEAAVESGLKHICITDHVHACVPWITDRTAHIRQLAEKHRDKIEVLCGIEASVIDLNGTLDASDEFYGQVDLVFGAIHDIPTDEGPAGLRTDRLSPRRLLTFWYQTFNRLLENAHVHVVAHPTAVLNAYGLKLSRTRKHRIARMARVHDKALERNYKYNVPDKEFLDILVSRGVRLVRGTDSHSTAELRRFGPGDRSS